MYIYVYKGTYLCNCEKGVEVGLAVGRSEARRVSQRKAKPDAALLLLYHPGNIREPMLLYWNIREGIFIAGYGSVSP